METNGTLRNILETTCIVQARARLTPTLTHVITYELVTSGAEDRAMSHAEPRIRRNQKRECFHRVMQPPVISKKREEHEDIGASCWLIDATSSLARLDHAKNELISK